jgi:hypothetical protein
MATKTKSKSNSSGSSSSKSSGPSAQEKFRDEQKKLAKEQNQKAPNAVPEQRPIAADTSSAPENVVAKRLRESGADQSEPMPKSAYDKADSDAQAKKSEKEELGHPVVRAGARIRVTKGPYEGSFAAVTSVSYDGPEEIAKANSGVASVANFAKVASVSAITRGDRNDNITLEPGEFEEVDREHYERGIA